MLKSKEKIHFIGVGGIGMSAIARILNRRGHVVTGSDEKKSRIIDEMLAEGIKCSVGHREENLGGCDFVVYSSSITEDNIELKSARKKGIKILHRSEMLSKLIEDKKSIAITGAHGKTTTTAAIALILEAAGKKPSAAVGGEVLNFKSNALSGEGSYFVLEADESDGSLLKYSPDNAVLLNIDKEHLDYFKDMANVIDIYKKFIGSVKEGGTVFFNVDDDNLKDLYKECRKKKISFGKNSENADVAAKDIRQSGLKMIFKCVIKGQTMPGEVEFPVPGSHNVTNALAAIAAAYNEGCDFEIIRRALSQYKGTKRRFEIKNTNGGITVVEDYAHHPTEIKAVLEACVPLGKRPIVVFQPHRYTRTQALFEEFVNCFKIAKRIILTDIYAASEKAIEGVTSEKLFLEMKKRGMENVEYIKKNMIADRVMDLATKDDIVLILGAGDINDVARELEIKYGRKP